MPSAVIKRTKYKNNISKENLIIQEEIKNREYKTLKTETLQAEIFDVLSKKLQEKTFNEGYKTWKKYLKAQRKIIQKKWKPKSTKGQYIYYSHPDSQSSVCENKVEFIIDKNGLVQERKTNGNGLTLHEVNILDPLPEEYKAETFKLGVNVKYYKYAGAKLYSKKPEIRQISPVRAEIDVAKNSRPPVVGHIQLGMLIFLNALKSVYTFECFDNAKIRTNDFIVILTAPLAVVAFVGWLAFSMFAMLIGVSQSDI